MIFVGGFYLHVFVVIWRKQKKSVVFIPEVPKPKIMKDFKGLENKDIIKLQKIENVQQIIFLISIMKIYNRENQLLIIS